MSPIAEPERHWPAGNLDEADTLFEMLDWGRATLLVKCAGLDDFQLARRAVPPSRLSLLGILRHMADVEAYWFEQVFLGRPAADLGLYDPENTGADFENLEGFDGEAVARVYAARVARSREIAASHDLGQLAAVDRDGRRVSLRWIAAHLIDEYGRHDGHADLLREVIDGATGY